jgi:hypothetical protein
LKKKNEENKGMLVKKEGREVLKDKEALIGTYEGELQRIRDETKAYECRNAIVNELLELTPARFEEHDIEVLIAKYERVLAE